MLLFFTDTISPRLQYIVDFVSSELFTDPIVITIDIDQFKSYRQPKLNYSEADFSEEEFYIRPHPLLFESGIRLQVVECFELNFHKAFFATRGDFSFDILAATFYLLSRYEEYLPHTKDEYGRYAHSNSIAFKETFLHYPLVNIWLEDLKKALQRKFPELVFKRNQFKCLLTYDVDMAWAYKHKGWFRNAGGILKSLAYGQWSKLGERWKTLRGVQKDPFDCFEWLDALHLYCRLQPYYFFLVAKKQQGYDRNTSTGVKAFRDLIEYYAKTYKIGIHPSWQSGSDRRLLTEELEWLETVSDRKIQASRQHYIRFTLPETFRRLINAGIRKEFSMGYGSINGYRASTCSSFYWYDLEKESATPLLIYPFCFMDANSFYEQNESPQQAYAQLMRFYEQAKKYNGVLITIWHNSILGTAAEFKGWREMFELFMKETVYWDAYYDEA